MNSIELNGASAEKIAEVTGGTIIAINGDTLLLAGGDMTRLEVAQ